mmetsp:Transcript_25166/g.58350  ORF Transcript_25166/g.58350 Transcript_25166/m.58350 type:complete len:483 (+) Transcript_25166:2-1450(+)
MENRQLEVDTEIMRGIPVAVTLFRCGRLWRSSPLDMEEAERSKLWELSTPVSGFDIFLSHTWVTKDKWKIVSLLFQFGWPVASVCWFLGLALAFVLGSSGLLPMPWTYTRGVLHFQAPCPFGPWAFFMSLAALFVGIILSPYILTMLGMSPVCFLDLVSIHQSDPELSERGIYGLGGFLRSSKELHVLWSPEYLSRLWCVFELAAFRKANPFGAIRLKPIFRERQIVWLLVGSYFAAFSFYLPFWLSYWMGEDLTKSLGAPAIRMLVVSPIFFVFHANRKYMREKHQLIAALGSFELKNAECRLEEDREFVLSAIAAWYGSSEAFVEYVRGPLRRELAASATDLPLKYALLVVSAPMTISFDVQLALWRGGAPIEVVLSEAIGSGLAWVGFWSLVTLKLAWFLCYRFASPASTRWRDYGVSAVIFLIFFIFWFAGALISDMIYTTSLWGGVGLACFTLLLAVGAYSKSCCCLMVRSTDAAIR